MGKVNKPQKPGESKVTTFCCDFQGCKRRFKSKSGLWSHKFSHSGQVKCPKCGAIVKNEQTLKETHECTNNRLVSMQDAIHSAPTLDSTVPSRIRNDFAGIIDLTKIDARDYGFYASLMNETYKVPHAVFEGVRISDIQGTLPIYIANRDKPSRTPLIVRLVINFKRDAMLNAADQATKADYENSGLSKIHLASAANYCTNQEFVKRTCCFTNAAPGADLVNKSQLKFLEDIGRLLVTTYQKVLIITMTIFAKKTKDVKYLNAGGKVGIPERFAKIFIYEKDGQACIEGWQTIVTHDKYAQPLQRNPFTLAKEAKLPLLVDERHFAEINNKANESYVNGLGENLFSID